MNALKKWPNVIRGVAYGDAWGVPNEFESFAVLDKTRPEVPSHLNISDDTQMSLFLAKAISEARTVDEIKANINREFLNYLHDPDFSSGTPGMTVTGSLRRLDDGANWVDATRPDAHGCGAVMRVSTTAFMDEDKYVGAAAYSAALTHGSAMCVAAAILTSAVIRRCAQGEIHAGHLLEAAHEMASDPGRFDLLDPHGWVDEMNLPLVDGFTELLVGLKNASFGLKIMADEEAWNYDPCTFGGEGWNADECLATALLCVDLFPENQMDALKRATVTNGDSDSIGGVAGAVLGALGKPWPVDLFARLGDRYQEWITESDDYFCAIVE